MYGIVKQSGGHIWVVQRARRGTTFKIYLPAVADGADRVAGARRRRRGRRRAGRRDRPARGGRARACATVVREILELNGYRVLEARHGAGRHRAGQRHAGPIHLLLTDVVMPQMSGRELAERLRPCRPDMRVLFMSGYTDDAIVRHGVLDAGNGVPLQALHPGRPRRQGARGAGRAAARPAPHPPMKPIRVLVAKVGLDGHDRGAKVVARALRDAGMDVIYTGLHRSPEEVVAAAVQEDVDVLGISILSGAHMTLFPRVRALMREAGAEDIILVGGGVIPDEDVESLKALGVADVILQDTPPDAIVVRLRELVAGRAPR